MNSPLPAGKGRVLQVTVRYDGKAINTRTVNAGSGLLPDVPVELNASTTPQGYQVRSAEGSVNLREGEEAVLQKAGLEVEVGVIRRLRFPRFGLDQADILLPVIVAAVSLLLIQLQLIFSLLMPPAGGGAGAPEPTPELIARLLKEQFGGADKGVLAEEAPRPTGEKVEQYYLPSGHTGPLDKQRGGKNVGRRIQDGNPNATAQPTAPPVVDEGTRLMPKVDNAAPADDVQEDDASEGDQDAEQIAEHITQGWGFTDWYDTEDARQDAQDIKKNLDMSRQLLKLDPNDAYALSIRAYYEYLSMDFLAARKTYQKFTKLYPDDAAGWNNLALTYKRTGDYKKEEELYQIALKLSPDDDHALLNLAVCVAHQGRYDEALAIMKKLESIIPNDPYADLHRAKIYAAKGDEERSYKFLAQALAGMKKLDTLHDIEFRQDIRVDPAFAIMRKEERFEHLLDRYYGDHSGGWWHHRQP